MTKSEVSVRQKFSMLRLGSLVFLLLLSVFEIVAKPTYRDKFITWAWAVTAALMILNEICMWREQQR